MSENDDDEKSGIFGRVIYYFRYFLGLIFLIIGFVLEFVCNVTWDSMNIEGNPNKVESNIYLYCFKLVVLVVFLPFWIVGYVFTTIALFALGEKLN